MSARNAYCPSLGLALSLTLVLALGAACNGRNIVGIQTGQGGSAGGMGGTGVGETDGGGGGTTSTAGMTGSGGAAGEVCARSGGTDGSFRFSPPIHLPLPRRSFAVAIADLNGDDKPDLAVANREDHDLLGSAGGVGGMGGGEAQGSLSVILSEPSGAHGPPQHYLPSGRPAGLSAGDLNGDGIPDLAVARGDGVSVLINTGDGAFGAPATFPTTGGWFPSVATGDVDGDGRLDFVVGTRSDVGVFLNLGNGTFIASNYPIALPIALVLADFTSRGRPDVVVASDSGVSVLLNDWNGGFGPPMQYGIGTYPHSIGAGDLNADTKTDLAVTSERQTSVMLNIGNGAFAAATSYDLPLQSIVIGDLNGDGRPDLAGAPHDWRCPSLVAILPNTGNGTFGAPLYFDSGTRRTEGRYESAIALHDMNGDGSLDVVVPIEEGISIIPNAGH